MSSGAFDYDARSQRPLVASVNAQGEVHSAGVTVTSQNAKIKIRDIGARYSLANGNASVTGIHAQLVGGTLGGTITMRDLGGATRSHLSASLHGASTRGAAERTTDASASSSSVTNQIAVRGSVTQPPTRPGARQCRIYWHVRTPLFELMSSRPREAPQLP